MVFWLSAGYTSCIWTKGCLKGVIIYHLMYTKIALEIVYWFKQRAIPSNMIDDKEQCNFSLIVKKTLFILYSIKLSYSTL